MAGIQQVLSNGTVVGVVIRRPPRGSRPATEANEPLQVLTLAHPKGTHLASHVHRRSRRTIDRLQECLFVRTGRVRVDVHGPDGVLCRRIVLKSGDAFLLQNGGYGIHMLEDSELVEVKNGPFKDDKVLL